LKEFPSKRIRPTWEPAKENRYRRKEIVDAVLGRPAPSVRI